MASLLEKLKVKSSPIKTEGVIIHLPGKISVKEQEDITREDIGIEPPTETLEEQLILHDRTDEDFDRATFLDKIRGKLLVAPKHTVLKPTPITTAPTIPKQPKKTKPRVKKIIGKKIKLSKRIDTGTITATVGELPLRITKKVDKRVIVEKPSSMLQIGDTLLKNRLPSETSDSIVASSYFMNNRESFINFINALFMPYRDELLDETKKISCEGRTTDKFNMLTHQKIVRDYLNLYTPYRGLLLYHGLGSGKTCSSIAIAEGLKSEKEVIIMTPASLRMNYIEQLKFCGDFMYKKNQFWEFIDTTINPEYADILSGVLTLEKDYIIENGGAWLVNVTKKSNYDSLTTKQQASLDEQLSNMIRAKYKFINYNGLRLKRLEDLTLRGTINPFDNKVVIIDEAHNFISRIVNKLKKPHSLSMRLYHYLMSAENARIVFLTGTPIINYPHEVGILFNMLRGYIKTWYIHLDVPPTRKINKTYFEELFHKYKLLDYIDYIPSRTTLIVTRNPFGFVNKKRLKTYKGVTINKGGQLDDSNFERFILRTLKKADFTISPSSIRIETFKALPDNLDEFKNLFIKKDGTLTNTTMLKRRILGLTSYFSDIKELMPTYNEETDFHEIKIEMSDYQFAIYETARQAERKQEKANAKRAKKNVGAATEDLYSDAVSTYRIFSRLFCNFVFPVEIPRPLPKEDEEIGDAIKKADEDIIDAEKAEDRVENSDGRYTLEDVDVLRKQDEDTHDKTYDTRISKALKLLQENSDKYLSLEALQTYSPKFLHLLENLKDVDYKGLHLIYSQFRTMEGIGILKLILEYNGFTQFKIKKTHTNKWVINIADEDKGKPTFALYTGTESTEEKDIIRNIFNSSWEYVPASITTELKEISTNNNYGEIIKILMITASGAEGVNLRNVRYVHLVEPYWHPVRLEQVIGRARRICSHEHLLETERTIEVFLYLMTLSDAQKVSDASIELRLKDLSKIDNKTPLTSDEALHEISTIKQSINKQLFTAIKESSIDCGLHSKAGSKEHLKCFTFGSVEPTTMSYMPSYSSEERDDIAAINTKVLKWRGVEFKLGIKKYVLRKDKSGKNTDMVYDIESYKLALEHPGVNPIYIGKLVREDGKVKIVTDI